jgi:hypothetical protein
MSQTLVESLLWVGHALCAQGKWLRTDWLKTQPVGAVFIPNTCNAFFMMHTDKSLFY